MTYAFVTISTPQHNNITPQHLNITTSHLNITPQHHNNISQHLNTSTPQHIIILKTLTL
ncbi:MAG: hypothetical protein SPE71_03465 [Prevotella sp.]|nr:hypothetical protein [Prevotella sp.]